MSINYQLCRAEVSYWGDGVSGAMPEKVIFSSTDKNKVIQYAKDNDITLSDGHYPDYAGEPFDIYCIFEDF